ncbi:MAG: hypothetical protein IPH09_16150 [bacterium]|nr:hypothetical protein [bacterium]
MRHVLTPLLFVLVLSFTPAAALAATAPADLAARLADWRARSLPDSVETLVASMLPPAREAGDRALIATLALERGMTRVAYGRAADGEADLREALALAEASGDVPAALKALRYLAEACQHLGRRDESAATFAELETRARAAGDGFHTGKALYGRGRLLYRARDLAGADSSTRPPAPSWRPPPIRPISPPSSTGWATAAPAAAPTATPLRTTRARRSWRGAAARARWRPWPRTTSPASR